MSVQVRQDNDITPFIRYGLGLTQADAVVLQDAGRTVALVFGTLMAKVVATGGWTPFIDAAATDGTAIPQGIFMGADVSAAKIVAGDVPDIPILIGGGVIVSKDKIVIENSLTLDTVITVGTTDLRTVQDRLAARGIYAEETINITNYENI